MDRGAARGGTISKNETELEIGNRAEWSMEHVHIVATNDELAERIAETFRGDGWTTSISPDWHGLAEVLSEWSDHYPEEPHGVIYAVRRNDDLQPLGLERACWVLNHSRESRTWHVVGVMTNEAAKLRHLRLNVVVSYDDPPETLLAPMRAGLEKRAGMVKQWRRLNRRGSGPSA